MSFTPKTLTQGATPILQQPPAEYSQKYMTQLVSAVNTLMNNLALGINITATNLNLPSLQTATPGLRLGVVYLKTLTDGSLVLSVVQDGDPH